MYAIELLEKNLKDLGNHSYIGVKNKCIYI